MTASSMDQGAQSIPSEQGDSADGQSFLRRTLPGEYLSLALIVHAGFGCLVWGAWSLGTPAGLLMVATCLWIAIRAAGVFAGRILAPLITIGLIVSSLLWRQYVDTTAASYLLFFSPSVFLAMLCVVLFSDVAEYILSPRQSATLNRFQGWNWHRIAIWAFVFAFLVYMVVIPTVSTIVEALKPPEISTVLKDEMTLGEKVRLRSMEAMTGLLFFALGATIGSFLNVVVFRMPRGESVVSRPSRCPNCETQIHGRDNVPILGWLLLNGRCRACQIPISSRYPIVETIMASMFLLLFFVELISGGANLPVRKPNFYNGVVWIIFYTKWDMIGLYFFHCFALSTLLTWALVDIDRQRMPWWASWSVIGILLAFVAMMPGLLPVPWMQAQEFGVAESNWQSALITSILGGLSGAVLGWLFSLAAPCRAQNTASQTDAPSEQHFSQGHIVSASVIAGMSVGWQATIGIWGLMLFLRPIASWITDQWKTDRLPATAVLLLAYLIHLVCWRSLNTSWWPSYETTLAFWITWGIVFIALGLANRILVTASRRVLPPTDQSAQSPSPLGTTIPKS